MEKIYFNDARKLIDAIIDHTYENRAYVVSVDDITQYHVGWLCTRTNVYFYTYHSVLLHSEDPLIKRYLTDRACRHTCCIYLSNCKTDKEYSELKTRCDKLKAFW